MFMLMIVKKNSIMIVDFASTVLVRKLNRPFTTRAYRLVILMTALAAVFGVTDSLGFGADGAYDVLQGQSSLVAW